MARSRELKVVLTGDTSSLDRAFAKAGKGADRMSGALRTAAKVGAGGIVAGLAGAVKSAATFEKQMSALAAVSDASGRQMEQFRKQALKAGADTAFSAKEAAVAQTELAKGGLSVADIMSGGLKSALALAAAGELELGEAAATTANAMNLFGLRGSEAGKVADALAMAANATTADVSDFGMALKAGGAVAKSAGFSFQETVVALEALAASGVKNSDAGTSLKTALIQLIKPTDKQAEMAKKMGLSFIDAEGNMKSLGAISGMLRDKLGGQTAAQRTATLATIAGTDGVRTLTSLYDAGPAKIAKWSKGVRETGTAAEVAKKKQDNLVGRLEAFTGSVETLAITVGSVLIPPLSTATKYMTDLVNIATQGGNPLATIGDTLSTAFDSVDWSGVGDKISTGFTEGADFTGKLAPAVATGISTALGQIDGRELLAGLLRVVSEGINALFSPSFWVDNFSAIFSVVTIVIPVSKILKLPGADFLYRHISRPFFGAIGKLGGVLASAFGRIGGSAVVGFLSGLERVAPRTANVLLNLVTSSGKWLSGLPGKFRDAGRSAGNAVISGLSNRAGRLGDSIGELVGSAVAKAGSFVSRFAATGRRYGGSLITGAVGRLREPGKIIDAVLNIPDELRKSAAVFFRAGWAIAKSILNGIVRGIGKGIGSVGGAIKKGFGAAVGFFGIGKNAGGIIPGRGDQDTVPAWLTPGEFVIRKQVVEKYGPTFFANLNGGMGAEQSGVQRFAVGGKVRGLKPKLLDSLKGLSNDSGINITVNSGFRTRAEQTALWNASDKSGRMVARPGTSNHESGWAADIAPQRGSFSARAVSSNSLFFPMSYEPWHIEVQKGARSGSGGSSSGGGGGSNPLEGFESCTLTYYAPSRGGINGRSGGGAAGVPLYDSSWGCAAPPAYPFGTIIRFAYKGKYVDVPVLDRGSAIQGSHFDLLVAPAKALGMYSKGKVKARFKVVGKQKVGTGGADGSRISGSSGSVGSLGGGSTASSTGGSGPSLGDRQTSAGNRIANAIAAPFMRDTPGTMTAGRHGSRMVGGSLGIRSLLKGATALDTQNEDAGTAYGQAERRFGQTDEDLGTAAGRKQRISEIDALRDLKEKTLERQQKRAAALGKAIQRYTQLLAKLNRARKKARGKVRVAINEKIRAHEERLDELKAELKALGFAIEDTKLDIGDLDKDRAEVAATADTGSSATDAISTALSDIDLKERAGLLTPEQARDARIGVLQGATVGAFGGLTERELWDVMGQLRDAIGSQSEAQQAATQAASELAQTLKDVKASIDAQLAFAGQVSAVTSMEAVRALSDIINGQLGQRVATRGHLPGDGQLARLA